MKLRITLVLFTFSLLICKVNTLYAAFPVKAALEKSTSVNNNQKTGILPAARMSEAQDNSGIFGILSIICGVVGYVLVFIGLVFIVFSGSGGMLALGALMTITAIILGAMGFSRKLKGLAIAGFILGILGALTALPLLSVFLSGI